MKDNLLRRRILHSYSNLYWWVRLG